MKAIGASHGGHSGDIVYGLALARHLALANSCLVDLYIASDRPIQLRPGMQHPNGQYLMSAAAFEFLQPLLELQPYIGRALFVRDAEIPADAIRLDPYRFVPGMNLLAGNIANYAATLYGISLNVSDAWLSTPPVKPTAAVTVAMSKRYRNAAMDYSFLGKVEEVRFVGLPDEYEDFKQRHELPNLTHHKCASAVELAQAIRSSKVFLGNQSMPFAVAEGLKVNRAVEIFELYANVLPTGQGAGAFIHQAALINLLRSWGIPVPQDAIRNASPNYVWYLSA
ncbi:MAG: hypothetical protein ACYDAE_07015 [Steroidobacteraceae bacterium]